MFNVAVIGAGVIGVNSAIEIQEKFGNLVKVTIFTSDLSPNTTGDVSAGFWTPYLLEKTPDEDIINWSKVTQDFMHELWREGHANEAGVSLVPIIQLSIDPNARLPIWKDTAYGTTELPKVLIEKYSKEHNAKYTFGYTYASFTCEPSKFLPFLLKQFISNGGELVKRTIKNLNELSEFHAIVNCCGLDAKNLVNDKEMIAIRGQVARVKAQWSYHVIFDDEHYIIPNMNCVILGGTHQIDDFDTEVRKVDSEFIFAGCKTLLPSLKNAELIREQVGLRPGRSQVRLELETRLMNGKNVPIVHNYGHGGSGVTLCKGCARSASEILGETLKINTSKL